MSAAKQPNAGNGPEDYEKDKKHMKKIKCLASVTPEYLNERSTGSFISWMGIEFMSVEDGTLTARMAITDHHVAPNGYLHAASVIALADSSCGNGTIAHLPEGADSFTTIELKSNHLGTATNGMLECTAVAQHIGRNTHVWDATVTHADTGKTIALFRCTQMILWPIARR